jgi:hypothetical protein
MAKLILTISILMLAGCDYQYYRYPCQNPANWDSPECQKPICEVNQTCPEHIFKDKVRCKE